MNASSPAYRILTRRLILRCWDPADAAELKTVTEANIEHLLPWMPWAAAEPTSLEDKVQLLRRFRSAFDGDKDYVYGIFERSTGQVLGGCGLHTRAGQSAREIGYWLDHSHWRQGLATELAAALTKIGFEVDQVHRIVILVDPENVASWSVAKKLGYQLEATLRDHGQRADGSYRDHMLWSLLSDEYPASPSAQAEVEAYDAAGRRLL